MSKLNIDIDDIVLSLQRIGYVVNDCIERENNGKNWQIKFNNSGAIATIYDSNTQKNTVVNGKYEEGENVRLKAIIDCLKCKELVIDPLNEVIVSLINLKKEDTYYDYKRELSGDKEDLLHDILCLSNNTENRDAYLIIGVANNYDVVGISKDIVSNNVFDFLKTQSFAGDNIPDIEIKNLFYKHKRIGVIVCKSSKYVPFYLTSRYQGVHDHQIYTRVGDTNTPKNQHASYRDTEKLWRIHFERENE